MSTRDSLLRNNDDNSAFESEQDLFQMIRMHYFSVCDYQEKSLKTCEENTSA